MVMRLDSTVKVPGTTTAPSSLALSDQPARPPVRPSRTIRPPQT